MRRPKIATTTRWFKMTYLPPSWGVMKQPLISGHNFHHPKKGHLCRITRNTFSFGNSGVSLVNRHFVVLWPKKQSQPLSIEKSHQQNCQTIFVDQNKREHLGSRYICARVKSRYIGNGHHTFNRESIQQVYKPLRTWLDDHPLWKNREFRPKHI